jgi:hypothetical protein
MDLRDYMMEIITSIILIASAIFLFFNAYYYPLEAYQRSVVKLSAHYEVKKKALDLEIQRLEKSKKIESKVLNSVPKILKALNDTCKSSRVVIRKLTPFEDNPFKFTLRIETTYFKFLKILSEFEKLNIVMENISLDEYETTLDNPKKAITLVVKVIGNVDETQEEAKELLDDIISHKMSKNPFQTNILDENNLVVRAINLTYIHTLSSVGVYDTPPSATIDNRIYKIGDTFLDKGVVTRIEKGKVHISKELDGGVVQKYFIGRQE